MERHFYHRRAGTAAIGFAATTALVLASGARAGLLDDFSDGDDVGWTRFTIPATLPGANWDPTTFVYRLSCSDPNAAMGSTVASFLDITGNDPYYWNGYWRVTVTRENDNSTTHVFMRGEFATLNSYAFGWYPSTGLIIQRITGGAGEPPLATEPSFVQEIDTKYILEAGAFGPDLELRMWPLGGTRPVLPQVECSDSTYTWGANGVATQSRGLGTLSATFDNVYFFTSPCPADVNGDGVVDVLDLLAVLAAWGIPPSPCPEDINGDGVVDVLDLLAVLSAWGPC